MISFLPTDFAHVNHRFAGPLSLLMMDIPWLLAAIIGLAATKVSCQEFGDLPPLPDQGLSNKSTVAF